MLWHFPGAFLVRLCFDFLSLHILTTDFDQMGVKGSSISRSEAQALYQL